MKIYVTEYTTTGLGSAITLVGDKIANNFFIPTVSKAFAYPTSTVANLVPNEELASVGFRMDITESYV